MNSLKYIKYTLKLIIAYILLNIFNRDLYKKNIWLIGEKPLESRDNGYHLFKYMREEHKELNVYYVIKEGSVDYEKIKQYGNIIDHSSMKHCIYWLACKYDINSQSGGASPFRQLNRKYLKMIKILKNPKQRGIYLKHGIHKDEMNHANLDYSNTDFSLVCCGAKREQEFIMNTYGYPETVAQLLGLCRFDNLHNPNIKTEKQILIMPTFRSWLKSNNVNADYVEENDKEKFLQSEFFNIYTSLLTNKKLQELLMEYDYKLIFYPHYSLQNYISLFKKLENDRVTIASRQEYDVQNLLMESSLLVTDFSSVFFDFAYMLKPEIFFQFDEEKYRQNHYQKGYFSYANDAFGPVVKTVEDVVLNIEKYLKSNMKIEEKYLKRNNEFFTVRDNRNCWRTYKAIMNVDKIK